MTNRVCVGAIAGAFGVRGEVRVKSFCAEAEDIAAYGPLTTEDGSRSFEITLTRPVTQGFAARLSGVATKEAADALRGTRLFAARAALPALPDDEFYHADLIGLTAFDTGGVILGQVAAVLNHGAGDLLELRGSGLKGPALVPFTRTIVPTVDLTAGRIIVDPPEGLLE
jgi:16S rRNA processing protein RimM